MTTFRNWAGNVEMSARGWRRPSSEAEIVSLVREARAQGGRLRPVGSRHSWSAIAADDDLLLDLDALDQVVSVDVEARRVTVGAGIRLHELVAVLARHGLGMRVVGSIQEQTLAGAIATATHGSSLTHGAISDLVRGLRLIDGTGTVRELAADSEELAAARVHLGALGVITEVTLDVAPRWMLKETRRRVPVDAVAAQLEQIAAEHEWAKVWWMPGSREAVIYSYARTEEPHDLGILERAFDEAANRWLFPALLRAPAATVPWVDALVDRVHLAAGSRVGWLDEVLSMPMPPVHLETEWSVPLSNAGALWQGFVDWYRGSGLALDFIQEIRFLPASDAWMSPAYGRDSCQLGIYGARRPGWEQAWRAFEGLARGLEGRPHWGKCFEPIDLEALYPQAGSFRALANASDPDRIFRSGLLRQLLGP